jgi:hypothetical protein
MNCLEITFQPRYKELIYSFATFLHKKSSLAACLDIFFIVFNRMKTTKMRKKRILNEILQIKIRTLVQYDTLLSTDITLQRHLPFYSTVTLLAKLRG